MGELNEIVRGVSQRQMKLKTKQKSSSKVTAASANVESNISNKKQTSQKHLMCKRVWLVVKIRY